jgi:RecB family exonuclease
MPIFDRKLSHSSLSTFRRCKVRYYWSYMMNLVTPSGVGQARGTIGHAALALWYTNMGKMSEEDRDKASMKLAGDMLSVVEVERDESMQSEWELLNVILPRYFDWARANDNFTEIIDIEHKFEISIDGLPLIGYIDGIVRINKSIWLLEHKFNKQVRTSHIDLDPQMSIYLLAARKEGINAAGVLYNVVRVAEGGKASSEPVERRQVFRNQEGLDFIEKELSVQMKEMKAAHEAGSIPYLYRTQTADCSWDCSYYDACLLINDCGDPSSELRKFKVREPDPVAKEKE